VKLTAVIPIHGSEFESRKDNLKAMMKSSTQIKLVIVADGFNRGDRALLDEMVAQAKFCETNLIHGVFGNPGSARNAGLEFVDSEWVCFWDSDDIPHPEGFKTMIEKAEASKSSVAKGSYSVLDKLEGEVIPSARPYITSENPARHLLDPGIWRYAFAKKVYLNTRFPPLRMGEDQDYLVKVLLSEREVFQSDEVVYTYRLGNETQITNSKSAFADVGASLKFLEEQLKLNRNDQISSTIILTSYIKQLVTGITRVGIRKSNLELLPILLVLLRTIRFEVLLKALKIHFAERVIKK
jgi:glycosyltransferase involved in cell wall biosynthesis